MADTTSIKDELTRINNEIAYWDVLGLAEQYDAKKAEMKNAEDDYNRARKEFDEKQNAMRDCCDC